MHREFSVQVVVLVRVYMVPEVYGACIYLVSNLWDFRENNWSFRVVKDFFRIV